MAVFNLLNACPINFVHGGSSSCKLGTYKAAEAIVDKLTREGCLDDTKGTFLNKLENSLMRYSGYKQQLLGETWSRDIRLSLFYAPLSDKWGHDTAHLRIEEKENGIFKRFVGVCGGVENISVNVLLEFGTKDDDQMRVEFKSASNPTLIHIRPNCTPQVYEIYRRFNLTDKLAEKWDKGKFSGKLTLSLTLNDESLNLIHRDNLTESWSSLGSKMLESVDSTGDAIIVAKNRKRVRCHKAVLISQNEVFKMMFDKEENTDIVKMNDISEAGVRALLGYLYCRDITEALKSSFITWELVMAADKYKIDGLMESMRDVILDKGNDWLSVSASLFLWDFARKKIDNVSEDDQGFKKILDKAVSALRSKPKQELETCPEFKEMLRSTETAQELCVFFILNK